MIDGTGSDGLETLDVEASRERTVISGNDSGDS